MMVGWFHGLVRYLNLRLVSGRVETLFGNLDMESVG